jgi:hypothetical protein
MKTPLHVDDRLDELDLEQFERMLASKSWHIYEQRLVLELERLSKRCVIEKDEIELRRAQGAATAVQAVMTYPRTILDELRRQPAKRSAGAE